MLNIPIYVYFLFIVLIYVGVKRSYDRIISIEKLFLTTLIFLALSIKGISDLFHININNLIFWFFGFIFGCGLGFLMVRRKELKADPTNRLIHIPGDWSMLILVLGFFIIEFIVHYVVESGAQISESVQFKIISLMLLGTIAGTSVGRSISLFKKYQIISEKN